MILSPLAVPPMLNVMSFNIRHGAADDGPDRWEVRRPRLLGSLKERHPDVIGLQEALTGQIDDIRRAMPEYASVGVGRDDGREKGEYAAILYDSRRLQALRSDTFWLSGTPEIPGSRTWGNTVTRVCTWAYFKDLGTGRFLYHFNVHLDHLSQPSREQGMALILRRMAGRQPNDPAFLTGDLNVGETNPVVAAVLAADFRDSFRSLYPERKDAGTFTGFRSDVGEDKIDYIFVGPGISVSGAEHVRDQADGRWISDHLPVTATITLD